MMTRPKSSGKKQVKNETFYLLLNVKQQKKVPEFYMIYFKMAIFENHQKSRILQRWQFPPIFCPIKIDLSGNTV